MNKLAIFFLCLALFSIIPAADPDSSDFKDISSIRKYLTSMEDSFDTVNSYYAIMTRQIRINDELLDREQLIIYFKKPFKIKIINVSNDSQVIFVEGENHEKMQVRLKTILGGHVKMRLDPDGKIAMKNELHSIRDAGMGRVIELINKNIKRGINENEIELEYLGREEKYDTTLLTFQGTFNADKDAGYFCKRAVIKVDEQTTLPREIKIYNWENELREWYEYLKLQLNVEIKDKEFSF